MEIGKLAKLLLKRSVQYGETRSTLLKRVSDYKVLQSEKNTIDALIALSKDKSVDVRSNNICHLFDNKINLALLKCDAFLRTTNSRERSTIARCVPETKIIDRDSVEMLMAQRDRYVLKRADSQSALHVVVGKDVSAAAYRTALACAVEQGDWIYQSFLRSVPRSNVFAAGRKLYMRETPFMISVFLHGENIFGMDCYLSVYSEKRKGFHNSPGYLKSCRGAAVVIYPES